jgi:valyl-tRNA synthetase
VPYVTEEVWSWWQQGSVHRAPWPRSEELSLTAGAELLDYEVAATVLGEVRKCKALQKRSLRAEVERVVVSDTAERLAALKSVERDVREAGNIAVIEVAESAGFSVETVFTAG